MKRYGPFNAPLRFERMLAKVTSLKYKNLEPQKLMDWPKEELPATIESVFSILSNAAAANRGK